MLRSRAKRGVWKHGPGWAGVGAGWMRPSRRAFVAPQDEVVGSYIVSNSQAVAYARRAWLI